MSSKVAIVTGGNKGIGLAIVRALCKQYQGVVYLTARDRWAASSLHLDHHDIATFLFDVKILFVKISQSFGASVAAVAVRKL